MHHFESANADNIDVKEHISPLFQKLPPWNQRGSCISILPSSADRGVDHSSTIVGSEIEVSRHVGSNTGIGLTGDDDYLNHHHSDSTEGDAVMFLFDEPLCDGEGLS